MRFVVSSDLQLHQYRNFAKFTDGVSSRLKDGLKILRQIRDFCLSNGYGTFIFLGDLFQVRDYVDVTTFNLAYDEFEGFRKSGIECFLLAGNHDQLLRTGVTGSLKSFRNVATVIYEPTVLESGEYRLCFIPFTEETEKIKSLVSSFAKLKVEKSKKFLFLHCSVDGAVVMGDYVMKGPLKVGDLLPQEFSQVLLGHYHIPQELTENVRYVGTPLDLNFGEVGYQKGFVAVDTGHIGTHSLRFIPTTYPRFVEVLQEKLECGEVDLVRLEGNYIRVRVRGEVKRELYDKLKEKKIIFEQVVEKKFEPLKRLPLDLGMELKKMLRLYVEMGVVETGGLDKSRLVALGEKFLEEAVL